MIEKQFIHGCHRHQFSKFPDFSLIKVKFPWLNKCNISDMVATSSLQLQQSFAPIWPEMLLPTFAAFFAMMQSFYLQSKPTFDAIKSVVKFQFSLTFLKNANFPWPRINSLTFPWPWRIFFPWPFPDLWQPCYYICHLCLSIIIIYLQNNYSINIEKAFLFSSVYWAKQQVQSNLPQGDTLRSTFCLGEVSTHGRLKYSVCMWLGPWLSVCLREVSTYGRLKIQCVYVARTMT